MLIVVNLPGIFLFAFSILQSIQASPSDNPRTNGIQFDPSCHAHQANLTIATRSAQSLAYAGLREASNPLGTVYDEYFRGAEQKVVKGVFQEVLGATRQQGTFPINVTCFETQACHSRGSKSLAFVNPSAAPDTINLCRALFTDVSDIEQNPCFNPKKISWALVILHELLHVDLLVGRSIWDVSNNPRTLWDMSKGRDVRQNDTSIVHVQPTESVQSYVFMACESLQATKTVPGACLDWKTPLLLDSDGD